MRSVADVVLTAMLLSPIAEAAECDAPADLHDGWEVAAPAQEGLDRGWLKDIDAPVLSFFPNDADLRGPDKYRITLRDLLTMTSGLA
jgi:Beta-lactamase